MLSVSIGAEAHGLGSEASIIGKVFGTARTIHSTASGDDSYSLVSLDAVEAFSVSSKISSVASGVGASSIINLNELVLRSTDIQIDSTATSSEALIGLANVSGSINELNLLSDGNGAQSSLNLEEATLSINKLNLVTDHGGFVSLDLTGSVVTIDDTISVAAHHSSDVYLTANIHSSDFNNIHVSAGTYGYVSVDLSGNITAQNIYISTSSEANVHVSIDQITLNGNIELYSSSLSSEVSGDWSTSSLDIQSLSGNLDHITLSAEDGGGTLLNVNGIISVNTIHLYASGDDYNGGISIVSLDGSSLDATLQDFTLEAYGGGYVNALLGNLSISGNLTLHADGYGTDVYGSTGDLNFSRIDLMAAINDSVFSYEDWSWHHGIHNISVIASDDGYVSLNLFGDSMGMDGNLEIASYHHGVAEVAFHGPVYMDGGDLTVIAEGISASIDSEYLEDVYGSDDLWAYTNFNLSLDSRSYINNINVSQSYKGNVDVSLSGDYAIGNINVTTYNDDGPGWGGGYATLDMGAGLVNVFGDITVTANSNENAFLTGNNILFSPSWYPGALVLSSGSITVTAYSGDAIAIVDLAGNFQVDDIHVAASNSGIAVLDLFGTTDVNGDISVQASNDNARAYLYANLSGSDLNNILVSAEYSAWIDVGLDGNFHADNLIVKASGNSDYYSIDSLRSHIDFSGDVNSTFNLHNLTVSSDVSNVDVILSGNLEIDGDINVRAVGSFFNSSFSLLRGSDSNDLVNADGSSLHDIRVTSNSYGMAQVHLGGNITVDGSIEIAAGPDYGYYSHPTDDNSSSLLSLEHASLNHANLTMFALGSDTNAEFNYQSLQGTIDDLSLIARSGGSVSLDMSSPDNQLRISGDISVLAEGNALVLLSADINGSSLHNISVEAWGDSLSNVNLLGSITVDGQINIAAYYGSVASLNLQSVDFENTDLYMRNAWFNYSSSTGNINNFTDIVYGSYDLSDETLPWHGWFSTQINGDISLETHYESSLGLTLLDVNSLGSNISLTSYQHSSISLDIQSLSGNVDHLNVLAGGYESYYSGGNVHTYANEVQLSIDSMSATIDNISMDSTIPYYYSIPDFNSDFSVSIQGKVNINQSGNININPGAGDNLSLNLDEVNANISAISIGNEGGSVNNSFASLQMNAVYGDIGNLIIGSIGYTDSEAVMTIGSSDNRVGLISDVNFSHVSLYQDGSLNLYASDHNAIYVDVGTFNVFDGALNLQSFGSNSMICLDAYGMGMDASGAILLSTDFGSVNQTINFNIGNITFNSSNLTIKELGNNSNIHFSPLSMSGSIHDLILETSTDNELSLDIGNVAIDGNLEVTGADGGTTILTNTGYRTYDLQSIVITGDGGNASVNLNAHVNIYDTLMLSNLSMNSNVDLYVDNGMTFFDANLIIENVGISNDLIFDPGALSGNIHDLVLNFSSETEYYLGLWSPITINHSVSVTGQSYDNIWLEGNIDGSSIHELTSIATDDSFVTINLAGDITLGSIDVTHDGLFITANSSLSHTTLGSIEFNHADLSLHAEDTLILSGTDFKFKSISGSIDNLTLYADSIGVVGLDLTGNVVSIHDTISIEADHSSDVYLTANIDGNSFNAIYINTSNNGYVDVNLAGDITLGSSDIAVTNDGLFITSNNTNYSNDSGNITLGNIHFNHADLSVSYTGNSIELHGMNHFSGTIDNLTLYADSADVYLNTNPTDTVTIEGTILIEANHSGDVVLTANIHSSDFNNIHVSAGTYGYVSVDLSGNITADNIYISTGSEGFASVEINQITLNGNIELYSSSLSSEVSGSYSITSLDIQSLSGNPGHINLDAHGAGHTKAYLTGNISTGNISIDSIRLFAEGANTAGTAQAYLSADLTGNIGAIDVITENSGSAIANLSLSDIHVTDHILLSAQGNEAILALGHVTLDNADLTLMAGTGNVIFAYDSISGTIDNLTLSAQSFRTLEFINDSVDISGNVSVTANGKFAESVLSSDFGDLDLQSIYLSANNSGTSYVNFLSNNISVSGNVELLAQQNAIVTLEAGSLTFNDALDIRAYDGAHVTLDVSSLIFNSADLNIQALSSGNVFLNGFNASGTIDDLHLRGVTLETGIALDIEGDVIVSADGNANGSYLHSLMTADMTLKSISVTSTVGNAYATFDAGNITVTDGILITTDSTETTSHLTLGNVIFDSANLTLHDFAGVGDFLSFDHGALSGTIDNLSLATANGSVIQLDLGSDVDISGNITVTSATNSESSLTANLGIADVDYINLETVNALASINLSGNVTVRGGVLLSTDASSVAHLSIEHLHFDHASLTINERGYVSPDAHIASFNIGSVSGTIDGLFLRVDDGAREGYNLSSNASGVIFLSNDITSVDIVGDIGLTSNGAGSELYLYNFSSRAGNHFDNISAVASDDGWLHLDAGNGFDLTIDGNLEIASYFHGNAIVDFGHPITMAGGDLTVIAEGISASIDSEDLEDEYGPEGLWAYTNFNVSLDSGSYINNINVSQSYLGEANVHLDGDYSVVNISVTTYNDDGSGWGGGYASLDLGTGVVNVSGNIEVSASRDEHANLSGNLDGSTLENIYISNDGGFVDVNLSGTFDVTGNIGLFGISGQLSMDLSIEGSSINAIGLVSNSGDVTLNLTGAGTVTDTINVIGAPYYYYGFGAQGGHSSLSGSVDGSIFHNMTAISVINGVAEVDLSGNITLTGTLSVKALDYASTNYCSESTNANDVIMQYDRSDDPTFSPSTYVAFDHINFDGANLEIDKAGSSADLHLIINDASGTLNNLEVNAESGAHLSYYLPDNVSMSGDLTVKAVADNQYVCNDIYFTSVSFDASLANSFMHAIDIEASNLSYDFGSGDINFYQGAFVSAHILGSINVQNISVSASAEDRASLILDHVSGPIDQVYLSVGEANSEALMGSADVNFAAHFDSAGYIHNLNINSATHFFLTDSNNVTVDISQSTFGGNVFISSELVFPWCVNDDNHINLTYHGATASFVSIDENYEGGFNLTIDIGDQDYVNANDILKTSLTIDGLDHVSSDLSLNRLSGEMYINTSYEIDFNSMFNDAKDKIDNLGMNFYFAQLSGNSKDGYLFYDTDHKGITQMIALINVDASLMIADTYDFARQFGASDFTYTVV